MALPRESVSVCDIGGLRALRLRNCGGWDIFLKDIVRLCLPIGLKALEILAKPGMLSCDADEVLSKFLAAFDGLEELYVCLKGHLPTNLVWPGVINHRATLKRFVHHLRMVDFNSEFNQEIDEADLGLNVGVVFLESLDKIQLEAMGLSIGLQDMVSFSESGWYPRQEYEIKTEPGQVQYLLPSARSKSLKFLHLRQSGADLNTQDSKFFERVIEQEGGNSDGGINSDEKGGSDEDSCSERDSSGDGDSSSDEVSESYRLQPQLRRLAEWAFGPDGISSLKLIACGDFAYRGRPSGFKHVDVILCRPAAGSEEGFRILDRFDESSREERKEIIHAYRNFLDVCPVEPLFVWD